MHFQKQDLEKSHYQWPADTKGVFTGQPSRRIFDKFNGNQVLFIINFFCGLSDRFTLREGKDIERKIHDDLPAYAKSEVAVFNWIRNGA